MKEQLTILKSKFSENGDNSKHGFIRDNKKQNGVRGDNNYWLFSFDFGLYRWWNIWNHHKAASNLVKAQTQAEMIHLIMDDLTEEEVKIYKRGRNAKAITRAKNASMSDYRVATGFEALMGWLYLTKQSDRMMELIKMAVSRFKNNEENKRG